MAPEKKKKNKKFEWKWFTACHCLQIGPHSFAHIQRLIKIIELRISCYAMKMKMNHKHPPDPFSIEKYTWKWELNVIWYVCTFIFDFKLFHLKLKTLFFNIMRTTWLPDLFTIHIYYCFYYWNILVGPTPNCDAENAISSLHNEVKTRKRARIAFHLDKERMKQCDRSKNERISVQ